MSSARVITTTEKFDETGKLVERTTREEMTGNEENRTWKAQSPWATQPLEISTGLTPVLCVGEEKATKIVFPWLNW